MDLIRERFIDVISYTQPKEYKPAKPSQALAADMLYALESTEHLLQQLHDVVTGHQHYRSVLTAAEYHYSGVLEETMTLYTALVRACSPDQQQQQQAAENKSAAEQTVKAISSLLQDQESDTLWSLPTSSTASTLAGIADLHALGMLRESTTLVKLAAASVTSYLEKTKVVDKARAAKELAWVEKVLKDLRSTCSAVEDKCKARVKSLGAEVGSANWQGKVRELVLNTTTGEDELSEEVKHFRQQVTTLVRDCAGGDARLREWAATATQSWKEVLGGWASVQYMP